MINIGFLDGAEITVLIDNRIHVNYYKLKSTWGLSILIKTIYGKIIFDLNSNWNYIYDNAKILDENLDDINFIVISHMHGDHSGGLNGAINYYLDKGVKVTIILPKYMRAKGNNIKIVYGHDPVKLFDGAITTGILGFLIKEQSLILNIKDKGPVIFVGCSHPGLNKILERTCKLLGVSEVYGVIGGYHIGGFEAYNVAKLFRKYNVKLVGPAHCTSDSAINILKSIFKENFIEIYTGLKFEI